jgi:hypothetical protein
MIYEIRVWPGGKPTKYKHEEIHMVLCELYEVREICMREFSLDTLARVESLYRKVVTIFDYIGPYPP